MKKKTSNAVNVLKREDAMTRQKLAECQQQLSIAEKALRFYENQPGCVFDTARTALKHLAELRQGTQ